MPSFSIRSLNRLDECHQDLRVVMKEVIKYFDCTVICGHRGMVEQGEAFENGFSKVQFPNSKHNSIPSNAVDVVPYPIEWKNTDRMLLFIGYVLGISKMLKAEGKITHDIISGIDWDGDTKIKDTHFMDYPHFQIK